MILSLIKWIWFSFIVESQKDYHARRKHHHQPDTRTILTISTTLAVTATTEAVTAAGVEGNVIPEITTRPTTAETTTEFVELTTTSIATTPSTTTTSTTPPRKCKDDSNLCFYLFSYTTKIVKIYI